MLLESGLRSEFKIEIISRSPEVGGSLKTYLSLAGYSVEWHKEEPDIKEAQPFPHVTIVDLGAIKNLSDFLIARVKANNESIFLLVIPSGMISKIESFRELGVYGAIGAGEGLEFQALMWLDLICSELFLRYQNEQLNEQLKSSQSNFEDRIHQLNELVEELNSKSTKLESVWREDQSKLNSEIEKLNFQIHSQSNQIEDLIWLSRPIGMTLVDRVMKDKAEPISSLIYELETELQDFSWSCWFFKFMPQIQSFVISQYRSGQESKTLHVSHFKPQTTPINELMTQIKEEKENELLDLLKQSRQIENPILYALNFENIVEGIFCINIESKGKSILAKHRMDHIMQVFLPLMAYYRRLIVGNSQQLDPVTQLELKDAYYDKLNSEFARSRRLSHRLSVIKLSLDSLKEIEAIHGRDVANILLSQTAMIIRSSSRINDFSYRTDENEFSLILPHTSIKSAAITAERLRRIIEMHEFVGYPPGHATVSLGISEYPELAKTAEMLDQTARAALTHIQKRSLNKVCLYSPGENG
jgi:diguanylate cyclase (GGDEF)-like protein